MLWVLVELFLELLVLTKAEHSLDFEDCSSLGDRFTLVVFQIEDVHAVFQVDVVNDIFFDIL